MFVETMSQGSVSWYAIWTRSRHEQVVRQQLLQKGVEAFLPTIARWSRWKDRRKKIEWPLFPGYCFARFNKTDSLPVLKCTGVLNIVSFAGELAPIADNEVENLRRVVETTLAYDPCPLIREGAMVEVIHGPLMGIVGRLLRKDTSHATVMLSIELLNRAVKVEVEAGDVCAR